MEPVHPYLVFDYPEAKDLAKAFLTFTATVLVFSVTFAEKIVRYPRAHRDARDLLFSSWAAFIGSIVLTGTSIYCLFAAGLRANRRVAEGAIAAFRDTAFVLLTFGGVLFIAGLGALVLAAVVANPPPDLGNPVSSEPAGDQG